MDYKNFSSNRSNLQSSAIHPIIATVDKSGHFVPVGVTSAFIESGPKGLFGAFLEIFQLRWKKTQDRKESTCSQVMYYLLQAIQKKQ